jgi:hypothetical protein
MSSSKDDIDCPHSGTCLTVGQGSPRRHREPSVGLLDEAERRKGPARSSAIECIEPLSTAARSSQRRPEQPSSRAPIGTHGSSYSVTPTCETPDCMTPDCMTPDTRRQECSCSWA